jgi:hypothetical protein
MYVEERSCCCSAGTESTNLGGLGDSALALHCFSFFILLLCSQYSNWLFLCLFSFQEDGYKGLAQVETFSLICPHLSLASSFV